MDKYSTNWHDLRENTLFKLKGDILKNLIEKCRKKAGNLNKAIKEMDLTYPSFYYIINNKSFMVSVRKLKIICNYLSIPYSELNDKILYTKKGKIISINNPKFPICLNSKDGAHLLGSIVSDGTIFYDKRSKDVLRTKYSSSDKESIKQFLDAISLVFGEVHIQFEKDRNNIYLKIGSSIIGEALSKAGAQIGNKTDTNPSIPILIKKSPNLQIGYLRAVFGDEGSLAGGENCAPYITISRYSSLEKLLTKKEREFLLNNIVPLMKERSFPTGHITKQISFPKIRFILPSRLLNKIKSRGRNKLILGESILLDKQGINTNIYIDRLTQTGKGKFTLCTTMHIKQKQSILKFYKAVGFSLSRKQEKLKKILQEVNWINGTKSIQHLNT